MRNIILAAAAASALLLLSLVPLNVRAQGPNANGLTGPTQSASDSSLTLADLQNRRQQIVVASMNFSNDEQKSKFLQVYVPYQIRLKQILEGQRAIVEDYTKSQQNGVISSTDANRLLKTALALDDQRQDALAKYLRDLKPVVPEQQVLRAYEIENRIEALYLSTITASNPLLTETGQAQQVGRN
jgi:hypothetical protein